MPDKIPKHSRRAAAPAFDRIDRGYVSERGCSLISFAGCDYLGLAHEPQVISAAHDALDRYGLSTSASRQTSGNTLEHDALETELREFFGFEGALLTPDGYTANLAAAQALAPEHPVALLDERAHASLRDAARCAGMRILTYAHLDADDARAKLGSVGPERVALMTDSVFATDGALAPLESLLDSMPASAVLLVDDCHGFCVLGRAGRGTLDHLSLADPRLRLTTTLAKGLGCSGGVVCGPDAWIARARATSSAAVCTTPAPPASIAAARCALALIQSEPLRFERLSRNIGLVRSALGQAGFAVHDHPIPVFAVWQVTPQLTRELSEHLRAQGVFVPASEYPGGPVGVYLRVSVTAEHTPEQIGALASALASANREHHRSA